MMGRKPKVQNKLFYTAVNLEQRVRKDHILRKIKRSIDFDFIYNEVKDIRYVTPDDRHFGQEELILANRKKVYEKARNQNPNRWSKNIRNWNPVHQVWLNPEKKNEFISKICKHVWLCLNRRLNYQPNIRHNQHGLSVLIPL
jgi:hypothetical protein